MYKGCKEDETILEPFAASRAIAENLREIENLKLHSRLMSLPEMGYILLAQGLSHIKILHLSS